ncbi:prenyltransferase/squalene oxidase repeat-containing protein [Kitasatospora sp. CB01950]|uniref:prenyltransferase/squalene oxidase repeat-containing protein n=1 Tax=Kitasatospora sp. CB01950 TaxID=1703930 RepID=UPI00093DBAA6|nr:prenyltransferase/squalene oxidase repeat-containing protein [Kitasatospora sp. CB01950]
MLTAARLGAAALAGALLAGVAAVPALADDPASPSPEASVSGSPSVSDSPSGAVSESPSGSASGSASGSPSGSASGTASGSPASSGVPAGLYGKGDPQYDGVWRQSLALLALHQEKVEPAEAAVKWLLDQQCADGGWPSYRVEGAACVPATEDSNATAMAVQALTVLGDHKEQVTRGTDWLRATQTVDGTWAYNPGTPGDANSTALAVNALLAAGLDPATTAVPGGQSAYRGLASFQLGCWTSAEQRGAYVYQPVAGAPAAPNTLASAQALLAAAGGHLPVTTADRKDAAPKALACPDTPGDGPVAHTDSAEADASWLTGRLAANGQRLLLDTPGAAATADYNATAWSVLGLVASGHAADATSAADWLAGNGYAWAAQGRSGTDPAAAATLVLTARAAKLDPYNFGGANMVQLLVDSGPKPKAGPTAGDPEATRAPGSAITEPDENSGFSAGWLIGVGLAVGVGATVLLSLNRRRHNQLAAAASAEHTPTGNASGEGTAGEQPEQHR